MGKKMKDYSAGRKDEQSLSFVFEISCESDKYIKKDKEQLYTTFFVSKKKKEMKELSLEELENEIRGCKNAKMILIQKRKACLYEVRAILDRISKERGICSPIIEMDRAIMYFPELRYSDMGLLDYICKQNGDLDDYSLKMTGSSLIGGIYV